MKKTHIILIITLLFIALCINVFSQARSYPFEVKKTGQGKQSIIFIPGFASAAEVWKDTRAEFEKEFTCYTLTMAGFAGVKPQANAGFKAWETQLVNYIKDAEIEKPIIVGHSMGGGLALAIAADHSDMVSKIIVVDALPCLAALMDPDFKSKEKNDCAAIVKKYADMPDAQFYQMQKAGIPRLLEDTSKHELVVGWSVRSDRKTFAEMYCDFSNTDLREKIGNIKCPSLILLEAFFVNFKPAIEAQYKNLTTANLQYANKGLHFVMYDDKDWYLKQLHDFLEVK